MTDATDYPMYIDRRDEEVVKRFEQDSVYRSTTIKRMYKRYTDIRRDKTAEERKNNLFDSPCMEYTGTPGSFIFVGFNDE